MPNDEITPNDEAFASQFPEGVSELSDEELDEIAGGVSFDLFFSDFSQSSFASRQGRLRGARSMSQSKKVRSSVFRLRVLDATADDLKALGGLFGSISRIEGDD
jgi:hypothetical protein